MGPGTGWSDATSVSKAYPAPPDGANDRLRPERPVMEMRRQNRYHPVHASVAQLDRASVFGTEGCRFESCRAYWGGSNGGARPEGIATPENQPAGSSPAGRIQWGSNGGARPEGIATPETLSAGSSPAGRIGEDPNGGARPEGIATPETLSAGSSPAGRIEPASTPPARPRPRAFAGPAGPRAASPSRARACRSSRPARRRTRRLRPVNRRSFPRRRRRRPWHP